MRYLQQLDSRVKFSVVTDFPHEQSFSNLGVNVISTPPAFRPQKALYKARGLEWFRIQAQLHDDDGFYILMRKRLWTNIPLKLVSGSLKRRLLSISARLVHTMPRIHRMLKYSQGIILYNAYQFWSHNLITAADICRSRDDLGKFFLFHSRLHVPVFGVHGSFLLVRGKVENEVKWDSDSLVENFNFSLQVIILSWQLQEFRYRANSWIGVV